MLQQGRKQEYQLPIPESKQIEQPLRGIWNLTNQIVFKMHREGIKLAYAAAKAAATRYISKEYGNQNIAFGGISMGGQVARWALCSF